MSDFRDLIDAWTYELIHDFWSTCTGGKVHRLLAVSYLKDWK